MVTNDLPAACGQLAPNSQGASVPHGVWTLSLLQAALLTVQPLPFFEWYREYIHFQRACRCLANRARSVEECLGLMIPNRDASVGTVQLNTSSYLACLPDIYRDGRAPLKTLVVSSGHWWDQRAAGLFASLSPAAWLICSSVVCQLKCKHIDVYKLDTCPNSSWRDAIPGNTELQNICKAARFSYWMLEIKIWYQCQWIRPLLLNSSCCWRDFQSQTMDNCWAKLRLLLCITEISL